MGDELKVIWLLAVGLGSACLFGYIAQKVKQSPTIGYLLAGFIIGPNSPGFSADSYITDQLATIGVTLLMFAVGLNFNWKDLLAVKELAVPGALILSCISIAAGVFCTYYLGGTLLAGLVIGIAICVSSTVVIVRVLSDRGLLHTKQGHIVVGWTIVEDLISVFGLLLLPAFASASMTSAGSDASIISAILLVLVKIAALCAIVYLFGEKLIEKLLKIVARTRSHELFTLAILSCTFMIAIGSSYLFGVSLALGAFIAGVIVGKTDMSYQAAANALPMRDTFAVIFFLSVGMLFNPVAVIDNLPLFFGILIILLGLRPVVAFMIVKIAKYPSTVALTVALAISQIGEYSFILAEEGSVLKILPDNGYDIIVACAFITITLNPILFKLFNVTGGRDSRYSNVPVELSLQKLGDNPEGKLSFLPRAIVVGFGPVGQTAAREILKRGYHVTVVDQNIDAISTLKGGEVETIYGDAAQFHIMEKAQPENARLLVIATPEFSVTKAVVQTVQSTNPHLKIIARSRYRANLADLSLGDIPIICDEDASSEKMISILHAELDKMGKLS
ncbi:cation:proton antiporter [Estrella lausannensis]|uniref:Monovalent cation transporter, sodium/hydrogen exchanger family n=1 Tax=Estrella lausannensis TaxID=483423 RepID=A0A0H5DRU7_9BACT|nr:cation:proton antiporter [Estrella lausannensis]CRX38449.1 monovalent cation transporter, sodium/hydrogen exchanger family [Estrella lausannensis]